MSERDGKAWYQKGSVQGALVGGVVALGLAFLRPGASPTPQVVVIQSPPVTVNVPASASPSKARDGAIRVSAAPSERIVPTEQAQPARPANTTPAPKPLKAATDLGLPRRLAPDEPWFLPSLSTAITATFRETLGSRYVEITISAPDATSRFPARTAGASGRFSVGTSSYEVQVLSIDWKSNVNVVVRAVSGS